MKKKIFSSIIAINYQKNYEQNSLFEEIKLREENNVTISSNNCLYYNLLNQSI